MNEILLYYMYTTIESPEELMASQRQLCERLGLKGRIIVAKEGLNGTVEGTKASTEEYVREMRRDPRFERMHWKRSKGTEKGDAFPRLSIKVRKEIVSGHLGEDDVDPNVMTGKHLKPEELREWIERGEKFTIIDMRNDYELVSGMFRGTVNPQLKNFRDLPGAMEKLKQHVHDKVLTVCTGGVRCEKASGYLVKKGFKDVYQLDGGIVSYMEKYPGQDFEGSLYVFDKRKVMHFDPVDAHKVIGRCGVCDAASERYVNCANPLCHEHFICCENCGSDRVSYCRACNKTAAAQVISQ